ncbi:hypothetical protein D3C84_1241420 [compost metagenome]
MHGRGEFGSDGCIVPALANNRKLLQSAIESVGGNVPLWVLLSATNPSREQVLGALIQPFEV